MGPGHLGGGSVHAGRPREVAMAQGERVRSASPIESAMSAPWDEEGRYRCSTTVEPYDILACGLGVCCLVSRPLPAARVRVIARVSRAGGTSPRRAAATWACTARESLVASLCSGKCFVSSVSVQMVWLWCLVLESHLRDGGFEPPAARVVMV